MQLAANRFKYNGKEEQVTGNLEWLDYGARMYDSGLGRWFGVDPFQESFISLSPYNYCSGNPMVFIDPSGALVTHYVDKDYNVLLNTDDGSDDVVVVPDGYIGDFKKFASFYSDPELAPVYDSKGWNSYWKNKFGLAERQLSELELAVSDLYSGKDGKNKAIAYFLSHQGSDLLAAAWSETWYHLRSIESWVDGLSMTFVMKGMFKNLVKNGTNVVYQGIDKAGTVRYIGITERESAVRFAEHLKSGTAKSLLQYYVINGATGLSRTEARVLEQTLINRYGLPKNGGLLLNKINSIAPKNWWQYGIK